MYESQQVQEWQANRLRSLQMFPVAFLMFAAVGAVIYWENLYSSEVGFLSGVLLGAIGYWTILEAMTVLKFNRQLRAVPKDNPEATG